MTVDGQRRGSMVALYALSVANCFTASACAIESAHGLLGTYSHPEERETPQTPDAGVVDMRKPPIDIDAAAEGPPEYVLDAIIRDFKVYDPKDPTTNPDFENIGDMTPFKCAEPNCKGKHDDREIVQDVLGEDGTPLYKRATGRTGTTNGKASFADWFHDVPETNMVIPFSFVLTRVAPGTYEFDSAKSGIPLSARNPVNMFFPIDDRGFGNQGRQHNYSFTVELHTKFTYRGGEFFKFSGDDDLFVFIDKKLVINLGGIHAAEYSEVQLDDLGLTVDKDYSFDLFSAERRFAGSNMSFTTTIYLQTVPPR